MNLTKSLAETLKGSRKLLGYSALILFTEFVRGAYLNYLPLHLYKNLGLSEAIVGAVGFAYFFSETTSKIGIGWLLDRYKNKIILFTGLLLSLFSLYIFKFIESPLLLIIDGALIGLGFTPVWLVVLGYITTQPEEKRATGMGIIYASWLTGLGLGTILVNFMITRISYAATLNLMILVWIGTLIISLFIKDAKSRKKEAKRKETLSSTMKEFKKVRFLIPGMFLQTLAITVLVPIIPKYLTDKNYVGISLDSYGITLAAVGITTVIFMAFSGKACKRIRPEKLFIFGLLFVAVGIIGLGVSSLYTTVVVSGLITAVSFSAVLPSWYAIISNNISEHNKGVMWGAISTIEGIGRSLGPLLGGLIGSYMGLRYSLYFSALVLISLTVFYYWMYKKKLFRRNHEV